MHRADLSFFLPKSAFLEALLIGSLKCGHQDGARSARGLLEKMPMKKQKQAGKVCTLDSEPPVLGEGRKGKPGRQILR